MRVLASLMGLLLLAASVPAVAGTVAYQVEERMFEGYYLSPAPDAPLVLLVHDWDGLTDYEVVRARMLADAGYAVFAVDLFGRGVRPSTTEEKRRLTGDLYRDRALMRSLLQGGLAAAARHGATIENAVAAGYCFGGAAILELARSGADLKGFVSFHGGLETPAGQDYARVSAPLLILHGTADSSVTMAHFSALAVELEKAGVAHEMITYGGAPHAFTVFGSERYRRDADSKSWQRFGRFLAETLR